MSETGVRGYESSTWYGVLAPKATPRPIIDKLNQEIVAIIRMPEVNTRLLNEGAEPVGNSPEEFGKLLREEVAKYAEVVKLSGAKAE